MNTSAKGSAYENAFKHVLLARTGTKFVIRAAASKGPFDLVSIHFDKDGQRVELWQLKNGRLSCRAAERLMVHLWIRIGYEGSTEWSVVIPNVVHKTKEKEFCEH